MIDLLILYSLKNRERTLYSLRSDITERFGYFTKPSIGTLHPALKRLLAAGVVTVRNDFSQGGKKSTYYGLAMHWQKKFRDLFFTPLSPNPSQFFTELQARISVMSLLDDELKQTFIEDASIKLESFALDLQNAIDDPYTEFDKYQTALLKKNLKNVEEYKSFLQQLENN